jgi:hypothetical protein
MTFKCGGQETLPMEIKYEEARNDSPTFFQIKVCGAYNPIFPTIILAGCVFFNDNVHRKI